MATSAHNLAYLPLPPSAGDDDLAAVPQPHPRLAAANAAFSRLAAVGVVAVGALVLVGWVLNVEVLKSLMHPNRVAMDPATAVAFVLAGLSLWLSRPTRAARATRRLALICAAMVAGVGLVKLVGIALDRNVWIDRALFAEQLYRIPGVPNQMAPNTALGFLLVGLSLLLLDTRKLAPVVRPSTLLALAVLAIAVSALAGYLYGVETLRQFRSYIPMALNTAITFLLLSAGILCARPGRQPLATVVSDTPGGVVARRLLPAAFFLPLLLGYLWLLGRRRDLFGIEEGVLAFVLAVVVVFVALVWWSARRLYRADVERRQAAEGLRHSEAVYHSLVETIPQNIFRKDLDGRFTFANQNFCNELGRPLDQIVGRTDHDFFPKELADRYRGDDATVIATGGPLESVEAHVTPEGKKIYVQVIKTPVTEADGTVAGTQGIFWDVTERVESERLLRDKNVQLEDAARSERQAHAQLGRTYAELAHTHTQLSDAHDALKSTQSQLVQTEKLAGLGQMVAGVAHEINNPLSFVSNNVAVLQRDLRAIAQLLELYRQGDAALAGQNPQLAAEIKDLSDRVDINYTLGNLQDVLVRSREGLRRIQQIVKDLRDFARLDQSDLQEADLNAGIESTVNIIRGHAKKKRVEIETDLAPLPLVWCHPAKLNQVVMNLTSNAIDASHEGGTVTVRSRREGDDRVRIEVQDRGVGIKPDVRDRIFDPFYTTKPPGHGTGLGLSISYGIVKDHGGTIAVESEVGKGSTFSLVLPVGVGKDDKVKG